MTGAEDPGMSSPDPASSRRRRPSGPPVGGWGFGATGIPRGFWIGLTVVMMLAAIFLLAEAYTGYGFLVAILALAAAVNLIP